MFDKILIGLFYRQKNEFNTSILWHEVFLIKEFQHEKTNLLILDIMTAKICKKLKAIIFELDIFITARLTFNWVSLPISCF